MSYLYAGLGIMIAMGFIARILPFLFSNVLRKSALLRRVGVQLPGCIMLLLVVHNLEGGPFGIAEVAGIATVIGIHLWKRSAIASMAAGTLIYIVLGGGHV